MAASYEDVDQDGWTLLQAGDWQRGSPSLCKGEGKAESSLWEGDAALAGLCSGAAALWQLVQRVPENLIHLRKHTAGRAKRAHLVHQE